MRRFIVIFLLVILPIQVLAESLTDLPQSYQHLLVENTDTASHHVSQSSNSSLAISDLSNSQQIEHADINDSLSSAYQYSYHVFKLGHCVVYRRSNQPITYPPLRKPPRF